jgi:hypothetical protein
MEASSAGKREYWDKGRRVQYWARLGCWFLQCNGLLSLGGRFETYEAFISLVYKFFPETANTESADSGQTCIYESIDNWSIGIFRGICTRTRTLN